MGKKADLSDFECGTVVGACYGCVLFNDYVLVLSCGCAHFLLLLLSCGSLLTSDSPNSAD